MLIPVLLLLLVQLVDRIANNPLSIIFQYDDLYEGDHCRLGNSRIGICRKGSECLESIDMGDLKLCQGESVVCCDVVRQQCEEVKKLPSNPFTNHIVGNASEADVGEFPFVALVQYDEENMRCGASIISKRFLLTAAHCHSNKTIIKQVRMGCVDASDSDAVVMNVRRVYKHPEYRIRTKHNDIALIELEEDIQMDENIKPICLYTELEDVPENSKLTVMGWGVTETGDLSKTLLKGTIQPVLRTECQTRYDNAPRYRNRVSFVESQLCALGDQDKNGTATDACGGDSGGPLVVQNDGHCQLVGVVSFGAGCGSELHAGVYTRVSKHLDWMVEVGAWNKA